MIDLFDFIFNTLLLAGLAGVVTLVWASVYKMLYD